MWLPVTLKKITVNKGHIEEEGPAKCLPSAAA